MTLYLQPYCSSLFSGLSRDIVFIVFHNHFHSPKLIGIDRANITSALVESPKTAEAQWRMGASHIFSIVPIPQEQ
jgi:hypothetical protein